MPNRRNSIEAGRSRCVTQRNAPPNGVFRRLLAMATLLTVLASRQSLAEETSYPRVVRPILAKHCFPCHGSDEDQRQADLRLDRWEDRDGEFFGAKHVISQADPDASELLRRILSDDPELRMPPPDSGRGLDAGEIAALNAWIRQGAAHPDHWAFTPPRKANPPSAAEFVAVVPESEMNAIDRFIAAGLQGQGMRMASPANRETLLRRLSLDLIGLPPTLEELAAFDEDPSYARQVERLLASPHYGERWGRIWLDAARYADSDGFEKDKPRFVWMYRDWVIQAINADMPFDRFIVEQVAGDLLPNPTQDQRVATGFLRNSMLNEEGGIDPEQFRMEAMFDRMDAIGKGVLGLTIQCAQCHNHKYDPLSQREYYQLFAFLNNCHEGQITVYTAEQLDDWARTKALIDVLEERLKLDDPAWRERMAAWEAGLPKRDATQWTVVRPDPQPTGGQKHYLLEDGSILAQGYAPTSPTAEFTADAPPLTITAVRLELINDPNLPHGGPGRSIHGTGALSEFRVSLTSPSSGAPQALEIASATADVNPVGRPLDSIFDDRSGRNRVTGPIAYAMDKEDTTAWTFDVGPARSNVPHEAVFLLKTPVTPPAGSKLTFALAQLHGGWNSDDNQNNNLGRFRLSVGTQADAAADPVPAAIRQVLAVPSEERNASHVASLFSFWRTTVPRWQETNRRIEGLWQSHPQGTTQMVAIERTEPRPTHRLHRGDFLQPREEVTPGVPAFLHPLDEDPATPPRLAFARWLVVRDSPTTARALVNRVWQTYFGAGLVTTPEDLGTQASLPLQPELLDWLAVEVMEHGWSLKHLHRLIVHSATYKQSSDAAREDWRRDPANVWLGRGARFRVDAESVRDILLSVSGLLTPKIGGPSVFPPAPEFLFVPPASYGPKTWIVDQGPDRYRRGMYTFRFRSVPHPALQNFDAPSGEVSCVRRSRANTPLQALTLLNEPLAVEAARAFAVTVLSRPAMDDAARLDDAVRRCLSRSSTHLEQAILLEFLQRQRHHFASDISAAKDLVKDAPTGSTHVSAERDPVELAAWTSLARVLLNLDETITRE